MGNRESSSIIKNKIVMSLPIILRLTAQAEFDEAFDWYESQRSGLGVDFIDSLAIVINRINTNPKFYSIIFQDIRRAIVRKFPYAIFYRIEAEQITIIAIFHSKRDPELIQFRK